MTKPGSDFKDRLFEILRAMPPMDDPANRKLLARGLPPGPVGAIDFYSTKHASLYSIVEAADGMGQLIDSGVWALVIVARNALIFAQGTEPGAQIQAMLAELETRQSPDELAPIPEVIIGEDQKLPIRFLEMGLAAAKSVAKVLVPRIIGGVRQQGRVPGGTGTGWLIAPGLLLTNYHVIEARIPREEPRATEADFRAQATASAAWFAYDAEGGAYWEYALTELIRCDPRLDYALLRVAPDPASGGPRPLSDWGTLGLVDSRPSLSRGDRLNIIQHPNGGPKRLAIRSNFFFDRLSTAGQPDRLRYLTDTEPGSSGSPVFDDFWRVVALHHASVPVPNTTYKGEVVKYNNQGIEIHSILDHLPDATRREINAAQGWA